MPQAYRAGPVRLHFGAVDEEAWVYLDGAYIGEHTVKSTGRMPAEIWNEPFEIDITRDVRDGPGTHQLTVRVRDSSGAGGIWRRVSLRTTAAQ